MPDNVWDTSALVKLYVPERGSDHARHLADVGGIAIATITTVEFASALRRRTRTGELSDKQQASAYARFVADLTSFILLDADETVRVEAVRLLLDPVAVPGQLKGADSIQLASANLWFQRLNANNIDPGSFVVTDKRLLRAAVALELPVLNPEDYA